MLRLELTASIGPIPINFTAEDTVIRNLGERCQRRRDSKVLKTCPLKGKSGLFPASSAYYHGADTGHREALNLGENFPQSFRHERDFLCSRNPPLPRDDIPKRELTKPWTSESRTTRGPPASVGKHALKPIASVSSDGRP
ncbi:hypothetical protein CGGC5_v017031 [Colletotrichum fructicola Nara gc5]|uniref:Uncharacterized protein n=1 Tax=Colletotrichum fructicola (strain Nara gc5) TaxID=1213859 RepID=A0A7J6IEJ1_COLFN|nr:hypothetical protein CGGC5_v017210 [Colletotrichum fructicola Nara gc5]KAF4474254.1 hypothetical protein CGGC5_v017031 [Colletotrichum fructicola Nara gc5]